MVFEFPREEVLASIRSNRDAHSEQLEEAVDAWREELGEALEREIDRLAALRQRAQEGGLRPRDLRYDELDVTSPASHATDYEVAIKMLEMASTETVSLAEADFARYVLDQWDWRSQFDDYLAEMRFKRGRPHTRRRRA